MRAVLFVSHEVVHVTNPPRRKTLVNAIPGDGADARLRLKVCQAIAVFLLALDAAHKISLWNVRAKLGHHWETAGDVALCFSTGNVGFHFQDTRATPNDKSSATAATRRVDCNARWPAAVRCIRFVRRHLEEDCSLETMACCFARASCASEVAVSPRLSVMLTFAPALSSISAISK